MKTLLISFIAILAFASTQAQSVAENAIGLRLGGNDGFGAEVSYQRLLKTRNRLEFDLGWRNDNNFSTFKLVGLHQWVMNLDKGFNWYVGVGGGIGSYSYNDDFRNNNNNGGIFALIAGDIGIEYDFDIPLLLSLDFRPEIGLNGGSDLGFDIGVGIRYQF